MDHVSNREFSPELYPYYYPSVPQYRQIKKRSRFQRICCPCFRRQRRPRAFHEPYRPFVIPDEYYRRLDHLKQNGEVPGNSYHHHHHSTHQPEQQQTQTDLPIQRKSIDETNEIPYLGRRRSSVRFEDEIPLIKTTDQSTPAPKVESIPIVKKEKEGEKTASQIVENNSLQRNVSFRNNEDDLWTTIIINTDRSAPIQFSHYNRLKLENLSFIDTAITNNDNGVTAIHVNSTPMESLPLEDVENETPSSYPPPPPPPPPPQLCPKTTRHRPPITITHRHKPPPPPPSRSYTTSSEDETVLRHIKPVEEINTIVADKYNYNNLSQALKCNVERLKNTFIHAQENQSSYDKPMNIRPTSPQSHSSDC
jgi:hypothetical protein